MPRSVVHVFTHCSSNSGPDNTSYGTPNGSANSCAVGVSDRRTDTIAHGHPNFAAHCGS